jgi:hypothetical protein
LAALLAHHRPKALRGASLGEALHVETRQPARLQALFEQWSREPLPIRRAPPSLVFAVLGQARADGRISPAAESRLLRAMLTHWALHTALETSAQGAQSPHTTNHSYSATLGVAI